MRWNVKVDLETNEQYIAVNARGRPLMLNPYLNKGSGFPAHEREVEQLHVVALRCLEVRHMQGDRLQLHG